MLLHGKRIIIYKKNLKEKKRNRYNAAGSSSESHPAIHSRLTIPKRFSHSQPRPPPTAERFRRRRSATARFPFSTGAIPDPAGPLRSGSSSFEVTFFSLCLLSTIELLHQWYVQFVNTQFFKKKTINKRKLWLWGLCKHSVFEFSLYLFPHIIYLESFFKFLLLSYLSYFKLN